MVVAIWTASMATVQFGSILEVDRTARKGGQEMMAKVAPVVGLGRSIHVGVAAGAGQVITKGWMRTLW